MTFKYSTIEIKNDFEWKFYMIVTRTIALKKSIISGLLTWQKNNRKKVF